MSCEASESYVFTPGPSLIANAGQGLFYTAGPSIIPKGTIILEYSGAVLSTGEAMRRGREGEETGYLMRLGMGPSAPLSLDASNAPELQVDDAASPVSAPETLTTSIIWIDASANLSTLARYINDCRNPIGHNTQFVKQPHRHLAEVVTTRDIALNEELFINYGKLYWGPSRSWGVKVPVLELGACYAKNEVLLAGAVDDPNVSTCLEVWRRHQEK
jgi:uncharacterized protein YdbL (DUF1318 family)